MSHLPRFLLQSMLALCLLVPALGQTPSAVKAQNGDWKLTWHDEFNQKKGKAPDPTKWVHETGGYGWGNEELEYYTDRIENSFVRNGKLVITARREGITGPDGIKRDYTSARLHTKGKFVQAYGRFEARIRIPYGQGIWPAFWLLGGNIDAVGWSNCGEIDIMENIGKEPAMIHGTVHGPGFFGANGIGAPNSLRSGRFADKFHVFAVEWEPNVIRFYVDGNLYNTVTPSKLPQNGKWVFDHPFFIILNVAVGGLWPGNPDNTSTFPQAMQVDYVRVYSRPETRRKSSATSDAERGF
jgi:beta-glucanase (GH16 family)